MNLTKEQIEESPPLDEDAPISRQYEIKYFQYYQYPYYWTGGGLWEGLPYPPPVAIRGAEGSPEEEEESAKTVCEKKLRKLLENLLTGSVQDIIF